ncbi:sodium/potassium/calcium exchanger 1-like [Bacillus rossius redtenbacheri]|uniref:sodium/potassium/calcium exchanger 1-like n=1 Tax=Bacillus rossius redtenbacheri TaxID=93214 RepID=UPI002FDEDDDA
MSAHRYRPAESDVEALSDLEDEEDQEEEEEDEEEEEEEEEEEDLAYPGFVPVALRYLDQSTRPRNWCLCMITNPYPFPAEESRRRVLVAGAPWRPAPRRAGVPSLGTLYVLLTCTVWHDD